MQAALALGRRGQGRTWPNPAVGCIIEQRGRVVGRGWTQPGGRPHAEVKALAQAGAKAKGATAHVTLEPCAHHGKTGPCSQALSDAGVARVSYACTDPNPQVAGQGAARLLAAGVEIREGVCALQAAADHRGFFMRLSAGRPRLTLKLATSLDGRIATATGESQWITGPAARRNVHAMRARHDAVLVGAGTARDDNPSLTVRDLGTTWQPVRVVMSRRLDLPLDGPLMAGLAQAPLWILHCPGAPKDRVEIWQKAGAQLMPCPLEGGQLDLDAALKVLGDAGLTSVFCEGGGTLAAALLNADLVDDLVMFGAGLAIGAEGRPGLGALGLDRLAHAPRFSLLTTQEIGGDTLTHWRRP